MKERKERKERKKKGGRSNRYRDKGNLICYKGASEVGALPVDMARPPVLARSLGCHHPCHSSMHLGHQDGWHPMLGSRYGKSFPLGLFVKNVFQKGQNEKNYMLHVRIYG
jgi:hypothetical protein